MITEYNKHHIVYVLISRGTNLLAGKLLLSLYTLRKVNPDVYVTLLTDASTIEPFSEIEKNIKNYVSDIKIVDIPEKLSLKEKSRYLKTSLRRLISGDFLYIDCDTLILKPITGIFQTDALMAAVLEEHSRDKKLWQVNKYLNLTSCESLEFNNYYNSGVLYVKDHPSTHRLFEDWHKYWLEDLEKYNYNNDQPALAKADFHNPGIIKELDGTFNFQPECVHHRIDELDEKWLTMLWDVKIFHYHSTLKNDYFFPLKRPDFWDEFEKSGITPEIEGIIGHPQIYYLEAWIKRLIYSHLLKEIPAVKLSDILARKFPFINKMASAVLRMKNIK